jgi:hypothetical protein
MAPEARVSTSYPKGPHHLEEPEQGCAEQPWRRIPGLTTCPQSCWCSQPSAGAQAGGALSQGCHPQSPVVYMLEEQHCV